MTQAITNATILTPDENNHIRVFTGHIIIEGDEIVKVLPLGTSIPPTDETIDASNMLAIPGLINSHLHSDENLFKGMFDNLPLELWMLYSYPPRNYGPIHEKLIYLRTLIGAIEMVKHGVTAVQDDVSEWPVPTVAGMEAVGKAYSQIGLRANVGANLSDKGYPDKLPFVRNLLPETMRSQFQAAESPEYFWELSQELISRWHGHGNRIQYFVSPSAPQRCSQEFLTMLGTLAHRYDLRLHSHVLETRMQRVTGLSDYNGSLISYLKDLDLLSNRLTIIHSVWVSREDIDMLGNYKVNVVHNPASNLKLGSGIMPYRALKESGANIALGTDGMSSNDSQNMFEAMKLTALLHKVTNPDFTQWPTADEVLKSMWLGGALSLGLEKKVGRIAVGYKADLALLDLRSTAFVPRTNLANQLVYSENGRSVRTVIVAGRVVVSNGEITTLDEQMVLDELTELSAQFYRDFETKTRTSSDELFPYIRQAYNQANATPIGTMNRWLAYEEGIDALKVKE